MKKRKTGKGRRLRLPDKDKWKNRKRRRVIKKDPHNLLIS